MGKSWVVYRHTDPNGKVYIGITCASNPEYRWSHGMKYKDQPTFFRAIVKYGWDNFNHEILYRGLEYEDACETEIRLIAEHNSTDRKHGYNVSLGGESVIPYEKRKISDEKKAEMNAIRSEIMKEKWKDPEFREKTVNSLRESAKRPEYRKRVSDGVKLALQDEELRKQRSETMKRRMDNEEYRAACVNNLMEHQDKIKKKVFCVETGETFDSVTDAAREYGISTTKIYKSATHKTKNPPLHWEYVS